jgi:acetoacetyl-CoA synthetase
MRREGTFETGERLMPFRLSARNEPLFFMHLGDGSLHYVLHLVRDLKSNRPVYGLQPRPLDGTHRILGTFESMATSYIADIKRVQPRGPYFLMGYSIGGWVVFEIAQQLVREGEQVNFLGLIDTILRKPPVRSRAALLRREVRRKVPEVRRKVKELRGQQVPLYVISLRACKRLAFRMRNRSYAIARWLSALRKLFKRPMSHTQRSRYYEFLAKRARRRYTPQPYPGHLTIFASIGNSEWQRLCWKPLVQGGLTVFDFQASHGEMGFPPHSRLLAEKIDGCLERP